MCLGLFLFLFFLFSSVFGFCFWFLFLAAFRTDFGHFFETILGMVLGLCSGQFLWRGVGVLRGEGLARFGKAVGEGLGMVLIKELAWFANGFQRGVGMLGEKTAGIVVSRKELPWSCRAF